MYHARVVDVKDVGWPLKKAHLLRWGTSPCDHCERGVHCVGAEPASFAQDRRPPCTWIFLSGLPVKCVFRCVGSDVFRTPWGWVGVALHAARTAPV